MDDNPAKPDQNAQDGPVILTHSSNGRSTKAAIILIALWGGLICMWVFLSAAPWIVALLLLATLPAAWEFMTAKQASFCLTPTTLTWQSGRSEGEIAVAKITSVRLETRLDWSVRVKILVPGKRIVLPHDCVPPHQELETALQALGVSTSRHHFTIG
ncbi:hypothetical protein [Pelagimonas varians]|uniref:Uncharacterized protein n=1 Tax=Pelagimonas varians TaxID=696760 RepID=A0A238KE31_9RHOB|nr:hypothetical protein [Pelagimonas varians]PYG29929.1 hypothetical protein C8N36_10795 [Pelagimonas varians]SMX40734.1 hypothetical protein PEV8663_02100 [Pelagimonas varians]